MKILNALAAEDQYCIILSNPQLDRTNNISACYTNKSCIISDAIYLNVLNRSRSIFLAINHDNNYLYFLMNPVNVQCIDSGIGRIWHSNGRLPEFLITSPLNFLHTYMYKMSRSKILMIV